MLRFQFWQRQNTESAAQELAIKIYRGAIFVVASSILLKIFYGNSECSTKFMDDQSNATELANFIVRTVLLMKLSHYKCWL